MIALSSHCCMCVWELGRLNLQLITPHFTYIYQLLGYFCISLAYTVSTDDQYWLTQHKSTRLYSSQNSSRGYNSI